MLMIYELEDSKCKGGEAKGRARGLGVVGRRGQLPSQPACSLWGGPYHSPHMSCALEGVSCVELPRQREQPAQSFWGMRGLVGARQGQGARAGVKIRVMGCPVARLGFSFPSQLELSLSAAVRWLGRGNQNPPGDFCSVQNHSLGSLKKKRKGLLFISVCSKSDCNPVTFALLSSCD